MKCKHISGWVGALVLGLFFSYEALADVASYMPDFYAEPGLHPFRKSVNNNVSEHIDPFSGNLTLSYTDLLIPGNGGFDIRLQRHYNSDNVFLSRKTPTNVAPYPTTLAQRGPLGAGWSMHFGRVTKAEQSGVDGICETNQSNPNDDTTNNPVLETPDGRREVLFVNSTSFSALYITKSQWVAYCEGDGLLVVSPEGVKYTMNHKVVASENTYTSSLNRAWYTTRVEDRNGNYFTISYESEHIGTHAMIHSISSSDGRSVSFSYSDRSNPARARLRSVSANGQTWSYSYRHVTSPHDTYLLDSVTRPDGLSWDYSYYNRSSGAAGNLLLESVTYPYGATISYDYDYQCFNATAAVGYQCSSVYNTFYSLVVKSKNTGGHDISSGSWSFSYSPGSSYDTTTVHFPGGEYIYKHYGSRLLYGGSTIPGKKLWKMGLLIEKKTYSGGTLVQEDTYTWSPLNKISNELYVRPPYDGSDGNHPRYADSDVYAPVLTQHVVYRDGTNYVTNFSNFDSNYNPGTISESGQQSRTTSVSYFPRRAQENIVHLVKNEDVGSDQYGIFRTFDSSGNMTSIRKHGVLTRYRYTSSGDISQRIDARNNVWSFSSYYRGIPRAESWPEGVTIDRTVNSSGTIASETNGRGYRTSYSYDGMNQITRITPPAGAPITVSRGSSGHTIRRDTYTQVVWYDGFGRPSYINTEGIAQNINYDALGYRSFVSYPGSSNGISYSNDVLGRVTYTSLSGAGSRSTSYLSGNRVSIRDERGNTSVYFYRSFGDPDNLEDKALTYVSAPEGISISFGRNPIGLMTSATQGGLTRTYSYNSSNFLISETNPETGTTVYGRDANGNMTSRKTSSSAVSTFVYDNLNRLVTSNYPGITPNVYRYYDKNSNLVRIFVAGGVSDKRFGYDVSDNLAIETQIFGGKTYVIQYSYNNKGYLANIHYPSGLNVGLDPDDLGRPRQVGSFVTGITYHPSGAVSRMVYATGRVLTTTLNTRQMIERLTTDGSLVDLLHTYDAAGNMLRVTDLLNGTNTRVMNYDRANRLAFANGPWGAGLVQYNNRGDIVRKQMGGRNLVYNYANGKLMSVAGMPQGTISLGYDAFGNVRSKTGGWQYTYDDASNLRVIRRGGAALRSYDYDGLGNRIHTKINNQTTTSIYSKDGLLLAEYVNGIVKKEYAYLSGKLVAIVEKNAVDPNAAIALQNVQETGRYGWGYGGSDHKSRLRLSFQNPGRVVDFCAKGYDIDSATEIAVYLNSTRLGYLPRSSNNSLGAKQCFAIYPGQLLAGANIIELRQAHPGELWGVTGIKLTNRIDMTPILLLLLLEDD